MQLQCENCQKIVNTAEELSSCRSCSKPPPPPTRPRFDMDAEEKTAEMNMRVAFREGLLSERIPPFTRLDYRLSAKQGRPDPKPMPTRLTPPSVDLIDDEPAFV